MFDVVSFILCVHFCMNAPCEARRSSERGNGFGTAARFFGACAAKILLASVSKLLVLAFF